MNRSANLPRSRARLPYPTRDVVDILGRPLREGDTVRLDDGITGTASMLLRHRDRDRDTVQVRRFDGWAKLVRARDLVLVRRSDRA